MVAQKCKEADSNTGLFIVRSGKHLQNTIKQLTDQGSSKPAAHMLYLVKSFRRALYIAWLLFSFIFIYFLFFLSFIFI